MKLMCEVNEKIEYFEEANGDKKDTFIKGIFMQGNIKNRNGRMYPVEVLEKEVNRYSNENIMNNRAFGELGHPTGPTINLDRASHLIKELVRDGDNFVGKAKIMDTPMGNIVKNLMNEGASLGVSSRGMGTLKQGKNGAQEVQKDFYLATAADIVADPSAPDAYVQGVMENKEWVWDNGILKEVDVNEHRKEIQEASQKNLDEAKLKVFKDFISKL
jgi:hypothetical protein